MDDEEVNLIVALMVEAMPLVTRKEEEWRVANGVVVDQYG